MKSKMEIVRISLTLTLISALIAGVVALVNQVTYDKIEENLEADRREAIVSIFDSENVTYEPLNTVPDSVEAVYVVEDGGVPLGYCVNLNSGGFGGDINMMVGVSQNGKIVGVSIVSMSETPGLGTKVNDRGYLSQYIGQSSMLVLGADIDGISGATVSSKAVLAGVNEAVDMLIKMNLIGGGHHE